MATSVIAATETFSSVKQKTKMAEAQINLDKPVPPNQTESATTKHHYRR